VSTTRRRPGSEVTAACEVVEVSTSGYYDWKHRCEHPSARDLADETFVTLMRELFDGSDGAYGVPRMCRALRQGGVVA
jgi:putative transposase